MQGTVERKDGLRHERHEHSRSRRKTPANYRKLREKENYQQYFAQVVLRNKGSHIPQLPNGRLLLPGD